MFKPNYGECFVVCKTIEVEGEYKLDLPFEITSCDIVSNGKSYGYKVPQEDVEVLAHITYPMSDVAKVLGFRGFIDDNSTPEGRASIYAHPAYARHWKQTLAEYKGTLEQIDGRVTKFTAYKGDDADKLSPCNVYMMDDYEDK